ncbi:unnamed protein product (mitochondrion) [Plasmodiophora brassicae]|uniref:RNA-editing substrate-binding complex 6 protein domain-containing protein n=1 Tax=Plasmodiophora brassicae TaxID=37360 RepID=A0A3P3YED5_PLABS|nr:unnamed protein product [Plasmodiophora brassicae]
MRRVAIRVWGRARLPRRPCSGHVAVSAGEVACSTVPSDAVDAARLLLLGPGRTPADVPDRRTGTASEPEPPSDNKMTHMLHEVLKSRPNDLDALNEIAITMRKHRGRLRPKALANALHSISNCTTFQLTSPVLQLRQALIERFMTSLCRSDKTTPNDIAQAVNAMRKFAPQAVHHASSRAVNLLPQYGSRDLALTINAFATCHPDSIRPAKWRALAERASQLFVTCDPRTLALLIRAFMVSGRPFDFDGAIRACTRVVGEFDYVSMGIVLSVLHDAKMTDKIPWAAFVPRISELLPNVNPRALSNITRVVCSVAPANAPLVLSLAARAMEMEDQLNADDVSTLLQAFRQPSFELVCVLAHRANVVQDNMSASSVANVVRVLSYHPGIERNVIVQLAGRALEVLRDATAHEVALLAFAFSHHGLPLAPVFANFADRALQLRADLNAIDVSMTLLACVTAGHSDEEFVRQLLKRAAEVRDDLSANHVSAICLALTRSELPMDSFDIEAIRHRYLAVAHSMTPTQHANCLHAFVLDPWASVTCIETATKYLKAMPPGDTVSALLAVAVTPLAMQSIVDPIVHRAEQLLPTMDADQLATTLWALVSANRNRPDLFDKLLGRLVPIVTDTNHRVSGKALANMMWAGAYASLVGFDEAQGIIAWSIAALDLVSVEEKHLRGLWSRIVQEFHENEAAYPASTKRLWLTQLWLAYYWTALHFPNVFQYVNKTSLSALTSLGHATMVRSRREPELGSLQGDIVRLVRDLGGADNVQEEFECPTTGYHIDLVYTSPVSGRRVALEIDGGTHLFGDRINGATVLQSNLLRAAGWSVTRVDAATWTGIGFDKVKFVIDFLMRADATETKEHPTEAPPDTTV